MESIQSNPHLFAESGVSFGALASSCGRRLSDISIQSGMSGLTDALSLQAINQCECCLECASSLKIY